MTHQSSLFVAFLAGILSFFSPCILPLLPVYICFITGLSLDKLEESEIKYRDIKKIFIEIVLFVLGFSIIFVASGAAASSIGNLVIKNQRILTTVGGIVIIIFGLHIIGLFKIKYLASEKRIHLKSKPIHMFGSLIVGMTFAIGWTPCIGPILGSILALAATKMTLSQGVVLLSSYSLGLAVPFVITGLAVNRFLNFFTKVKRYFRVISILSGTLLIVVGILLLLGKF
ncbi:MAG: cytochrome c biogenesis protein CcdA [Elusimicrobiota bacterium]|nr:cytochrome c biogenesis protein CcdA [Elusimicrobiota bacterium]